MSPVSIPTPSVDESSKVKIVATSPTTSEKKYAAITKNNDWLKRLQEETKRRSTKHGRRESRQPMLERRKLSKFGNSGRGDFLIRSR